MTSLQNRMLTLLKEKHGHFTAENILADLRTTHPTAAIATVYRNLDIFVRDGKVRKIPIDGGKNVYEGNIAPHEHAICTKCGALFDFAIPNFSALIAENVNGDVIDVELNVKFICEKCRNKN